MGIQDRKKRQLEEREQLFLDKAWTLIQQEGVLNLQMSRLAAECEYAVGTLYLHFSSKEDLLVALATRNVSDRLELFLRAAAWAACPRDRMLAVVVADVIFSQRAPEYFRLAQYVSTHTIWVAASEARREAALEASRPVGEAVRDIAEEAMRSGDVASSGLTTQEMCSGIWAMTEGMHSLVSASGLLETHSVPRPYRLLIKHAHALLNGLGWQPIMPLNDFDQQQALLERILREVFPEVPIAACQATENQPGDQ
ncbi:helix-turn-helix domain-containing protein [Halioxenophilus sp. WMMB6]|uniref:TetR/AcrR family transcriptional regulator n=1 Tax=Halioxenophilus sp. WMMB6 TaxID=3073815 RepID=UPI00295E70AA|nr:helix-turn-helix domain-containing protein [Halioxenophilus sp. WMMB6]